MTVDPYHHHLAAAGLPQQAGRDAGGVRGAARQDVLPGACRVVCLCAFVPASLRAMGMGKERPAFLPLPFPSLMGQYEEEEEEEGRKEGKGWTNQSNPCPSLTKPKTTTPHAHGTDGGPGPLRQGRPGGAAPQDHGPPQGALQAGAFERSAPLSPSFSLSLSVCVLGGRGRMMMRDVVGPLSTLFFPNAPSLTNLCPLQENGKYVVPALIEKALQEADAVQQVGGARRETRDARQQQQTSGRVHRQWGTGGGRGPNRSSPLFPLEESLSSSPSPPRKQPESSQVLVYGTNRPHNVAILVPNWEKLVAYGTQHGGGALTANSSKVSVERREGEREHSWCPPSPPLSTPPTTSPSFLCL